MPMESIDLTGTALLFLYLALLVVAVGAGLLIPDLLRPEGRAHPTGDPDELAYLSGGRNRFSQSVIAGLLASGALVQSSSKHFFVSEPEKAVTSAERKVMRLAPPASWADIDRALEDDVRRVEQRLVAARLLMSNEDEYRLRVWSVLPYVLLILLGAAGAIGAAGDGETGANLALFLVLTTVLALIRWIRFDPRTRAGRSAIFNARTQRNRMRIAPTRPEIAMAVALFGPMVLQGSAWADFHQPAPRKGDKGAEGGCGGCGADSGCGGGGGCGGGCGS